MASRFGQRRVTRCPEYSDSYIVRDQSPSPLNERSHCASWWADREEHKEQEDSLREHLKEMDNHVARLQDMLRCERAKCSRLQLRSNQQEAELKRREQQSNRLKERLSQLTDRHREKGPSIEVLNLPPGGRGKREQPIKPLRSTAKREEATLRLMLERREAELREAMKLRHSLTTLLHALRVDMKQTLSDMVDVCGEAQTEEKRLDEAEVALGDHVTGGVVQSWRQVQRRMGDILSEGRTGVGTDHDKLLAQLETDLKESQQLVRLQQQLLQDSLTSPVPIELADSYFLEEWERLQVRWAELEHQKRTFERERQSFTDAAIRLSHERRDFERQKSSLLKQQYLCDSPLFGKGAPTSNNRRDSTSLNFSGLGPTSISGCLPITPSSTKSEAAAVSGLHQGRVSVQTPSTPELYSALNLSYNCREVEPQSETWDSRADGMVDTSQAPHLDWSF
ncbi:afadin- and alpha-actinin-binding protein isoform X2 [Micropterus salmoides]|uniref:afadin- and alpha-actinin-binding protein isoform X2 n=1 Tax=Micropterus salmoides TaxID=27706 RepID=UPI0018ED92FF|nr:afadin- and alpha-actinin-binding protein isoform X2 [Micropterus salmoides]XP_038570050.1 afadin- and alpha-actinin-binding protein isoform X2 [Micropterus salmoides]